MTSALAVAKYFLARINEMGQSVTQMKLYKLVYYAQAWSLVFRGRSMFTGEIQAWPHGPVPVELRPIFKHFSDAPIPLDYVSNINSYLEDSDIKVLDAVLACYGNLTPGQLRNLTHSEMPWLKARNGLPEDAWCDNPILEQDMAVYYSRLINSSGFNIEIPSIATSIYKDICVEADEYQEISGSLDALMEGDLPPEFLEKAKVVSARIQESEGKSSYPDGLAAYLAGFTD